MAEYELYWNRNDDMKVSTKMVISGSFGNLKDARAYAYRKIPLSMKHHLSRSTSAVIEIIGIDRNGNMHDYGKVGTLGSGNDIWTAYIPHGERVRYRLYGDGSVRRD